MDIQSTDIYGMLLRCVSSYVKKMQDDCIGDALYDTDVNTRNAAFCFVATNHTSEPEMWLLLSNFKYCRHSGITKHLTLPRHNDCEAHKVTQKYLARPQTAHDMPLIEFHHTHVTSSEDLHPYRGGRSSSIACKTLSPHKSEFLFQHTLLYVPFHSYHDFFPSNINDIPQVLQCYSIAIKNNPSLWTNDDAITDLCHRRRFKKHKILTFLSFVHYLSRHLQPMASPLHQFRKPLLLILCSSHSSRPQPRPNRLPPHCHRQDANLA